MESTENPTLETACRPGQMSERSSGRMSTRSSSMHFRNEFATVELRRDETANGTRLLVIDLSTGRYVFLDPLQIESLTRMDPAVFDEAVPPQ